MPQELTISSSNSIIETTIDGTSDSYNEIHLKHDNSTTYTADNNTLTTDDDEYDENDSTDEYENFDYNSKWEGYICIILMSLVSFASISRIPDNDDNNNYGLEKAFGSATFAICVIILICDRRSWGANSIGRFHDICNGCLEGCILLVFVIWWSAGVGIITRVGGVAYLAMNIYYSSWLALASCVYTLNQWCKENDLITLHDVTWLSDTSKEWYILWFWSLVEFASCLDFRNTTWGSSSIDGEVHNNSDDRSSRQTTLGITIGILSWFISTFIILEQCNVYSCSCYRHGGLSELCIAGLLLVLWMVCIVVMTDNTGIASSVAGTSPFIRIDDQIPATCMVSLVIPIIDEETGETTGGTLDQQECNIKPGSNLYLSIWFSFASTVLICLRWKASKEEELNYTENTQHQKEQSVYYSNDKRSPSNTPSISSNENVPTNIVQGSNNNNDNNDNNNSNEEGEVVIMYNVNNTKKEVIYKDNPKEKRVVNISHNGTYEDDFTEDADQCDMCLYQI